MMHECGRWFGLIIYYNMLVVCSTEDILISRNSEAKTSKLLKSICFLCTGNGH